MNEISILSTTILGGGRVGSLEDDIRGEKIDYIVAQGTSADIGPYYLGAGANYSKELSLRKELEHFIITAKSNGIPFICSIGGGGSDVHLEFALNLVNRIAKEKGMHFTIATISGEIRKDYLMQRVQQGEKFPRLVDVDTLSPNLTVPDINACEHIVAQMGPEPIINAMNQKVDGIIAGRTLDTALYMAPPLRYNFQKGLVAHMAKIIECGSQAAEMSSLGNIVAKIRRDHFIVYPPGSKGRCTVKSCTRHLFYERMNPFREENPGGYLDATHVHYHQHDEKTVKATGGTWVETPYRVKLEGAAKVGHRSICFAGLRDPKRVKVVEKIIERVSLETAKFYSNIDPSKYALQFRIYGKNAILGFAEPEKKKSSHELGILVDVVADTQKTAESICHTAHYKLHHHSDPSIGLTSSSGSIAFPFSPPVISTERVYVFRIWHLMDLEDPCEPFQMNIVDFPR